MFKKEIIIGGRGGQGIILSAIIIAKAAVEDGNFVIQSQNYGPESRGGASRADIIISDREIYYPRVQRTDIFLALTQEAFDKYIRYTNDSSLIIVDSSVDTRSISNTRRFGILEYAYNKLSKPFTVNMIAVGIINALTNIVSEESMLKSIERSVPSGTFDINFTAYKAGSKLLKT